MTQILRAAGLLLLPVLFATQASALNDLSYSFAGAVGEDIQTTVERDSVLAQAKADDNTSPQDLLAAARADYARLVGILQANGHYASQVSILIDGVEAFDLSPFAVVDSIETIAVAIDPGPAFIVGKLSISPRPPDYVDSEIGSPGDVAGTDALRASVSAVLDAWVNAGFADARVERQDIVADHERHTVDATIVISPGRQYRLGPLTPDDQDDASSERVVAVASLPEGELYSPSQIENARSRLQRTGAYRSVTLEEQSNPETGIVSVQAHLIPEKKRRLTAGVEFASPGGLTLSGGWTHRNFRSDLQALSFNGRIENILNGVDNMDVSVGAVLDRPSFAFPSTDLQLSADLEVLQQRTFDSQSLSAGATLSRDFGNGWIGFAGTSIGVTNVQDDLGDRFATDLSFPLGLTLDHRDSQTSATQGFRLEVTATPIAILNHRKAGAQFTLDARRYHAVGSSQGTVIAGRIRAGTTLGIGYRSLPPDMLFSSGGGGTVRGHAYQSLAIARPENALTGGLSFLGASAELRQHLWGAFGAVAFVDAGWLGAGTAPTSNDPWHSGGGLGLRYDTPVGPARLDIAVPITGEHSAPFHLYLGIGHSF